MVHKGNVVQKVVFTSFEFLNQNRYFTAGLFLIISLSLSFKEVQSTFSATGLLNFLIIIPIRVRSTFFATGLLINLLSLEGA